MKDQLSASADSTQDLIQLLASTSALLMRVPALSGLGRVGEGTLAEYRAQLKAFWNDECPDIGAGYKGSAGNVLMELLRDTALAELRWMKETRKVTWEQAESLGAMLRARGAGHACAVRMSLAKEVIRLPFEMVMNPAQGPGATGHGVWLMPRDGAIERFASEQSVVQHLQLLFAQPSQRQTLLSMITPSQQTLVNRCLQAGESPRFSFVLSDKDLFSERVAALHAAQQGSLLTLVEQLAGITAADGRQALMEQVRGLVGFEAGVSRKWLQLLSGIRRARTPDWLKYASAQDQAEFSARGAHYVTCLDAVDTKVGVLRDNESFALAHLRDEFSRYRISLDPAAVKVTLMDSLIIGNRTLTHERQVTLAKLALSGLHDQDGRSIKLQVSESDKASGLTADIVRKLVQRQELRITYPAALRDRHTDDDLINAMQDLQVARLSSSVQAAKMQGAISPALLNVLDGLRDSSSPPGQRGINTYFVHLDSDRYMLADVLVLKYPDTDGESFLLYAPHSPDGQDWLKCNSATQVRHTVGGWMGTSAGRAYLLAQVAWSDRARLAVFMERIASNPQGMSPESVKLNHSVFPSWREMAALMAYRQTVRVIDESHILTPGWYIAAGQAARQKLTGLDNDIAALTKEYQAFTQIPAFVDYARQTLQAAFDRDPKYSHRTSRFNVDRFTLQVDGQWRSLVWVAINGVARGTDVAGLPVGTSADVHPFERGIVADLMARFLASHDVPEDYSRKLTQMFLDPTVDQREWRAQLHLRITQLELDRARLQLQLDPEQRQRIDARSMVVQASKPIDLARITPHAMPQGNQQAGIYHLQIKDERVQGVYLFRDVVKGGYVDVVYTPHAPDGVWFRSIAELGKAIEHDGLAPYLRARVPFKHLPRFDRFLEKLANAGYSEEFMAGRVGPHGLVSSFAAEHDAVICGILRDVDASTVSKAERFSGLIIERMFQVLGVLALPFPPARMTLGVTKVLMNLYKAVEAYRYADRAQTGWHLLDAALGVASMVGVSGKPQALFLEKLFKGPPPDLAEKMIDKLSGRLQDELDSYLRSVTIAEKGEAPTHAWLQA